MLTEATIYIPYESEAEQDFADDLSLSRRLRFAAFQQAWRKCSSRLEDVMRAAYQPFEQSIVNAIQSAYDNPLDGLPYSELPVFPIPKSTSAAANIATSLKSTACVVYLHASTCTTLQNAVKTLIDGFLTEESILPNIKRRAALSPSNSDISVLVAWYASVQKASGISLLLTIICRDFESFDVTVMQDLLYICSLYIPQLPFVFVIEHVNATPAFLHLTYSRATLALLRIVLKNAPNTQEVLDEALHKTFLDPYFQPDVYIGPGTLEYIADHTIRHALSPKVLVNLLKLAYLKHFDEPMSILCQTTLIDKRLGDSFLSSLLTRIVCPGPWTTAEAHKDTWTSATLDSITLDVNKARIQFTRKMRKFTVTFKMVQSIAVSLYPSNGQGKEGFLRTVLRISKGDITNELMIVKGIESLPAQRISHMLVTVHQYLESLPTQHQSEHQNLRVQVVSYQLRIKKCVAENSDCGDIAKDVSQYFADLIRTGLETPQSLLLADIWYTGYTPFPSELINPNPRASLIAGLLYPHEYNTVTPTLLPEPEISQLPDTMILFQRYLDSGRKINIFDWHQSFETVLDEQRKLTPTSPKKRSRKGKGRANRSLGKVVDSNIDVDMAKLELDDEELWKIEVQSRFLESLKELEYLGLIRHTGKKMDFVFKTVFDPPD